MMTFLICSDLCTVQTWLDYTLRGTGMVFRRDIFLLVCLGLKTQMYDIELSLHHAEYKIPVYSPQ